MAIQQVIVESAQHATRLSSSPLFLDWCRTKQWLSQGECDFLQSLSDVGAATFSLRAMRKTL